jgi:hypothetical protein
MVVHAAQTSPPWRLPQQPGELIGREENLATVCEALLRPECHLLTLLGIGGIGKTRLAIAVAAIAADRFQDGVCIVDLTKVADAAEVPSLVAAELALQADSRSTLERVKGFLLLLDNVEHVLPAATSAGSSGRAQHVPAHRRSSGLW